MKHPRNYLLPSEDPDAFEDPAVADEFDESLLDGEFDEEDVSLPAEAECIVISRSSDLSDPNEVHIAQLDFENDALRAALRVICEICSTAEDPSLGGYTAKLAGTFAGMALNASQFSFCAKNRTYTLVARDRAGTKSFKNLAGKQFHHWTVVNRAPDKSRRTMWYCRCKCGAFRPVSAAHLVRGKSQSCGCVRPSGNLIGTYKHGLSQSHARLHSRWMGIIRRCENTNDSAYRDYGGRGISICPRWRNNFAAFFEDMGEPPFPGASIDRIDKNGNYEPSNCRWATAKQQARNTRRNRIVVIDGREMTLAEAAETYRFNSRSANTLILQGVPIEDVMRRCSHDRNSP